MAINRRTLFRLSGIFLAILFVGFAVWLIHEANIGRDNALFKIVRATPYGDKIGHFFLAGIMTLAVNFVLRFRKIRLRGIRLPIGSVILFFVVIIEEGSQIFMMTRSFDLVDAAANFMGILVFTIIGLVLFDRKKRLPAPTG